MSRPAGLLVIATFSLLATHEAGAADKPVKLDDAAVAQRLVARGTADSLATASVLKRFGSEGDEGAYPLIAQAVKLAPDRRDLAWLAIRLCSTSSADCDVAPTEQHLQHLDPANGAGWVGSLARAQGKNDASAVDAALTAFGKAERFDVYFNPLVVGTSRELAAAKHVGSGTPSQAEVSEAAMSMVAMIAGSVLPASKAFSYSCKGYALQIAGRMDRCVRAAKVFATADTYVVEGLGLSLLAKLLPTESPEAVAVSGRRRLLQYRLEEFSKLPVAGSNAAQWPADYLDVLNAHEREQDSAAVYLARAKVPLEPPAQWVSTQPPRFP